MRTPLPTLLLVGALVTAAFAPAPVAAQQDAGAGVAATHETRPEGPLARGLWDVPSWAVGAVFAAITVVSLAGLLRVRRRPTR